MLSLFCAGLGHVYVGRITRGLVLFLASLLFVPAFLALCFAQPSTAALIGILAVAIGMLIVYLFAAIDARRIAARLGDSYEPGPVNRPAIYALFLMVGLVYPVLSALLLRSYVVQAFKIPVASMAPTLQPGDRILVDKRAYGQRSPERGEIVVFRSPADAEERGARPGVSYVKRLVGLPGDRIAVIDGVVLVNGEPLTDREGDAVPAGCRREGIGGHTWHVCVGPDGAAGPDVEETTVPVGSVFVLGDNRANSQDSRHWGAIPERDLIGPAIYLYWSGTSWDRFGVIR